jgi:hypothetical protein
MIPQNDVEQQLPIDSLCWGGEVYGIPVEIRLRFKRSWNEQPYRQLVAVFDVGRRRKKREYIIPQAPECGVEHYDADLWEWFVFNGKDQRPLIKHVERAIQCMGLP